MPGFYREQNRGNSDNSSGSDNNRGQGGQQQPRGGNVHHHRGRQPGRAKRNDGQQRRQPRASQAGSKTLVYLPPPPAQDMVAATLGDYDLDIALHPQAFCSNPADLPTQPLEVGGRVLQLRTNTTADLEDFEGRFQAEGLYNWRLLLTTLETEAATPAKHEAAFLRTPGGTILTPVKPPPSLKDVQRWVKARRIMAALKKDSHNRKGEGGDGGSRPSPQGHQGKDGATDKTSRSTASGCKESGKGSGSSSSSDGQQQHHQATLGISPLGRHLSTSTPHPKPPPVMQPLHLTPITKMTIPTPGTSGHTPTLLSHPQSPSTHTPTSSITPARPQLRSRRRVSWESEQPRTTVSPLIGRKRHASLDGLAPLDEDPEGEAAPMEAGSQRKRAFRGLALDITSETPSKRPRHTLSQVQGTV